MSRRVITTYDLTLLSQYWLYLKLPYQRYKFSYSKLKKVVTYDEMRLHFGELQLAFRIIRIILFEYSKKCKTYDKHRKNYIKLTILSDMLVHR